MMVGVGAFLLVGFPLYYGITTREPTVLSLVWNGLCFGGLPLALAGVAWDHPTLGGAAAIGYAVLATILEGFRFAPIISLDHFILDTYYCAYLLFMVLYIAGAVMVLISRK